MLTINQQKHERKIVINKDLPGLKYRVSPGHNEKPLHIDHKSDHNKDIYEHY